MKKIAELSGDEFFDIIYALTPILPILGELEIIKIQVNNAGNSKKTPDEIVELFARDIGRAVPALTSKENRHIVFEILSIAEEKHISDIKKYPPPKLITKITQFLKDIDLKSFLSYADELE